MRQVKALDFTGKTIFCGIDVHKTSWSVCLSMEGRILKRFSQRPDPKDLDSTLSRLYPGADYKAVYEAGFCGFYPQRIMTSLGIDCIIVNPADVPTMDKEKKQKSDRVDCGKLAKSLCADQLNPIYIPSIQQQDDRCIVRNYKKFIKDQTRCKNRISQMLFFQGMTPNLDENKRIVYWSKNYVEKLKKLKMSTEEAKKALDLLVESYQSARDLVLKTTKQMRQMAKTDRHKDQIAFIRSVPGIGEIGALLFLTEIGDFTRFHGIDHFASYIGLIPNTKSSGENDSIGGITNRSNNKLREVLIEASWIAIRIDPAMTLYFSDYCKRMQKNKAIIKIAKKLLSRVRFVMINQTPYVSSTMGSKEKK
jgi:transposase